MPACRVDDEGLLKHTGSYITTCMVVQPVVKANSQSNGNWQISNPGAQKLLNGFRWNLEYITIKTMSGVWPHMQIRMVLWRCNNVGGLGEDVTCHMVRFLKPLTHDLSLRPSRRGIFCGSLLDGRHDGCQDGRHDGSSWRFVCLGL